jgi:catechol-2,3-dioxygenase
MNDFAETRSIDGAELKIEALGFVTVAAGDVRAARGFYHDILGAQDAGADLLPGFGAHAALRLPSRQLIVVTAPHGPDTRNTGVHHAYRVSPSARAAIARRLQERGVAVETYKEDRSREEADNFFFHDPDGNRIQLVLAGKAKAADGADAVDHTAVLEYDMLWAESYYGRDLGFAVESRVGVRTADHSRARSWADGEEAMAPGTRRIDKLYMTMGGRNEVARANMQVYFHAGDSVFGIYLATKHQQEPPEEQVVGSPRTAFITARTNLDLVAAILERRRRIFEGPVAHPPSAPFSASLYCKDLSGNFLEFCALRG